MGYDEIAKKATLKYIKNKQKRLFINYKKEEYETEIGPYIEASGKTMAAFIKEAVKEKIERDFPNGLTAKSEK